MKKNKTLKNIYIYLIIIIIFLLIFSLIGITYAWFSAIVSGNDKSTENVVENATLSIKYTNSSELKGENIIPGWSETKTFSVENTGTANASYNIIWENLTNEFILKDGLVYTLTSDNNGGTLEETIVPDSGENINIITNITIEPKVIQTYTLTITYKNTNYDQSSDAGKKLKGKIEVSNDSKESSLNFNVNAVVVNGTIDGETSKTVKYGSDVTFTFSPTEGCVKPTVDCTNNQSSTIANNVLTINNISNDTICTVSYVQLPKVSEAIIDKWSSTNNEGLYKLSQAATTQMKATTEYRYSGKNPKNYVSFNDELWRIIGVFEVDNGSGTYEKRVKIMRNDSIGTYSWDSSAKGINDYYDSDYQIQYYGAGINQWGASGTYEGADLMRELNDLYYNSKNGTCYTGINNMAVSCDFASIGLKEEARKMITDAKWYTGATNYINVSTPNVYKEERGTSVGTADSGITVTKTANWLGKIGLIYVSDYAYASSVCYNDGTVLYNYNDNLTDYRQTKCTNSNWLYKGTNYWTISPVLNTRASARNIGGQGSAYLTGVNYAHAVLPTTYLKNSVGLLEGTGTNTDPYQLSL